MYKLVEIPEWDVKNQNFKIYPKAKQASGVRIQKYEDFEKKYYFFSYYTCVTFIRNNETYGVLYRKNYDSEDADIFISNISNLMYQIEEEVQRIIDKVKLPDNIDNLKESSEMSIVIYKFI